MSWAMIRTYTAADAGDSFSHMVKKTEHVEQAFKVRVYLQPGYNSTPEKKITKARMKTIEGIFLLLLLVVAGCMDKTDELCPNALVGKVVSTHPSCAGIVVEVTQAPIPDGHVDATYTDDYGNTFTNVFMISNICEMDESDVEWLSAEENVGVEFAFYLYGPTIDDLCPYCKPLVKLPEKKNKIALVKGSCIDQQQQSD